VPQLPLLWQPTTSPSTFFDPHDPVEHDLHPIFLYVNQLLILKSKNI
jgi:hypothetical protein